MNLIEIQYMLQRLSAKKKKTARDKKQIDFLEEKILEMLDHEIDQNQDMCSYSQKI